MSSSTLSAPAFVRRVPFRPSSSVVPASLPRTPSCVQMISKAAMQKQNRDQLWNLLTRARSGHYIHRGKRASAHFNCVADTMTTKTKVSSPTAGAARAPCLRRAPRLRTAPCRIPPHASGSPYAWLPHADAAR